MSFMSGPLALYLKHDLLPADAQARRGPPPQHEAAAPAPSGSDGAAEAAAHWRAVRSDADAGDADAELQPGGATEDATTNEP